MQYRSKMIQICKGFQHVPYVRVRRKSTGPLERIRRKYCGPAPAEPQKKVRICSSGSAKKSANPLKQIRRKKCGFAQADSQKKVWIRSSGSADKVQTCLCRSTEKSGSAQVNPQQKVRTCSCESAEKTQICWCESAADPLIQMCRVWCGPTRTDLLKNMWTRSSRSAQPQADPLRSNNAEPFVFANHRPFSRLASVYFAT